MIGRLGGEEERGRERGRERMNERKEKERKGEGRERKRGHREREGRGWEGEKECVGEVVSAGRLVRCRPRRRRFPLSQVAGHPSALTLHSSLSEGAYQAPCGREWREPGGLFSRRIST